MHIERSLITAEFMALWRDAVTLAEVAEKSGMTKDRAIAKAKSLGLPPRKRYLTTKAIDVPLLCRLWNSGVERMEIARQLGTSENHVSRLAGKHKLKRRPKGCTRPPSADPTPEEIVERAAEQRAKRKAVEDDKAVEIRCYTYDDRTGLFQGRATWVA